jgi:hypothetical protein
MENELFLSSLADVFSVICQSEKNRFVAIRYGLGEILQRIISKHLTISTVSLLGLLLNIVN